jgi:hypothetical protein
MSLRPCSSSYPDTTEQAVAKRDIANFRAAGLRETLNIKKKKRQKSKTLNVLGLPSTGTRLFVSGNEINDTKAKQKDKKPHLRKKL